VQRFVRFSAHPEVMQQHRQLSRRGHDGSLLSTLASPFRQLQPRAPQIAVDTEWSQNYAQNPIVRYPGANPFGFLFRNGRRPVVRMSEGAFISSRLGSLFQNQNQAALRSMQLFRSIHQYRGERHRRALSPERQSGPNPFYPNEHLW
jgi:hypothetical protein